MEPVDPTEAPDYYKVIKEPMGKTSYRLIKFYFNKCSIFKIYKK